MCGHTFSDEISLSAKHYVCKCFSRFFPDYFTSLRVKYHITSDIVQVSKKSQLLRIKEFYVRSRISFGLRYAMVRVISFSWFLFFVPICVCLDRFSTRRISSSLSNGISSNASAVNKQVSPRARARARNERFTTRDISNYVTPVYYTSSAVAQAVRCPRRSFVKDRVE